MKGLDKNAKLNNTTSEKMADEIIKNTYKTLMTRGMKGCYIYCTDDNLRKYLKEKVMNVVADSVVLVDAKPAKKKSVAKKKAAAAAETSDSVEKVSEEPKPAKKKAPAKKKTEEKPSETDSVKDPIKSMI